MNVMGTLTDSFHLLNGVETAKLSAVGISLYCHRHGSEIHMLIIGEMVSQKDQSCAGGKHRHSDSDFLLHRLEHFQFTKKLSLYCAFPAGSTSPSKSPSRSSLFRSSIHVRLIFPAWLCALQRLPAQQGFRFSSYLPLSAIRSWISCSLIPTIASPRSSESSASILES